MSAVVFSVEETGLETTLALRTTSGQLDHTVCRIKVVLKMLLHRNDELLGERVPIRDG